MGEIVGKSYLERLREVGKRLEEVDLSRAGKYGRGSLDFSNFAGWTQSAQAVRDPDQARNILYYGFQPLYDALLEQSFDGQRANALTALDQITQMSIKFLTDYYSGKPDVSVVNFGAKKLEPIMMTLRDSRFATKTRNIDHNGITPKDILTFLKSFVEYSLNEELPQAEYIIGAACGASEVAMPLAGITGVEVGFMRKSKRRDDGYAKIVKEHELVLADSIRGKNVFCVEDYVCQGTSLSAIMDATKKSSPRKVIGLSVNLVREDPFKLRTKINQGKFRVYN